MENQKCKNICKKAFDYLKQHLTSIIVCIIIIVSLYVYFKFINSNPKVKMSFSFSDYNAYLIPILTAINIFVFIRLTNKIDENNKKKHKKEIEMQIKLHLFKIRTERIKELNETFIQMRKNLMYNDNELNNCLLNVKRQLINNFENSLFFSNEYLDSKISEKSSIRRLIDMFSKNTSNIQKIEMIKNELYSESFIIIQILEIFTLEQLKSESVDSAFITVLAP